MGTIASSEPIANPYVGNIFQWIEKKVVGRLPFALCKFIELAE